ncbi:MAG: HAD family phosphatase [Bacteroidota bacterium]
MIKAVIFDLDGTLIQTEVLKANSYAFAIHELTKADISKEAVLNIFNTFVGLSRQEVVAGLSKHFKKSLRNHLNTDKMEFIGEILIEKRLQIYRSILEDTDLLSKHFCPFTLGLFHRLYNDKFTVVLATMSHLPEAKKVTETMGIYDKFNLVLTRDDVENGKPEPDIYLKAKSILGLDSEECLVIEDSVNGIRAAQNADMPVFAVTNSITIKSVHDCGLLAPDFMVDDLVTLESKVFTFIESSR